MNTKTIIKNGTIVTEQDIFKGDLLISGEIVSEIGKKISCPNAAEIDAEGSYVLPGGIDVHTHFNLDIGTAVAQDDFYTGTVAAAFGGTTTIVDHPGFGPEGCSLHHQIEKYHTYAKDKAVIDYSFHGVLQHLDETILNEIPQLINEGITSLKAYMTYGHRFSNDMLKKSLETAGTKGGLIAVHAEDDEMVTALRQKYILEDRKDAIYHALSRPAASEGDAVKQAINMAEKSGSMPLYIVHLSTREGLDYIVSATKKGENILAETCPQYLLLDSSLYALPDHEGLKFVMSPPLRGKEHHEALWKGLADGDIQVVGTDHCPFDFSLKKKMASHDFSKCPGGAPGVETRIPLMFSEGVNKERISLRRFTQVISENPAKIMGLYPKKGVIAMGSDADIMILDPNKEVIITKNILHENVDYTPYEGIRVKGWPILTMVRGKPIVQNGKFYGTAGSGHFIKRKSTYLNM